MVILLNSKVRYPGTMSTSTLIKLVVAYVCGASLAQDMGRAHMMELEPL